MITEVELLNMKWVIFTFYLFGTAVGFYIGALWKGSKIKHRNKHRKLKYYKQMETIAVPTEVKIKRKDGTILILKAKKIIRKTQNTSKRSNNE